AFDVAYDSAVVPRFEGADVDDHIDLGSAVVYRSPSLKGFGLREVGPKGKTGHRADFHGAALQKPRRKRNVHRLHTNRSEAVLQSLLAEPAHVVFRGVRL